ncbi:S1 RNA-binding domain-containing protein [Candidatus Woesearchaeota archaeon]|nr:S1 RNA-binding domain-containing protein [Candidatus Woesearchaeota archaeon]
MALLRKREGLPEEGELVLCTVTKVYHHSVFCNIHEYERQGMIHISEVSPGRIRNLGDFVKEGKTVICKILRIDHERNHIDLSLRRVNESEKRFKSNQIKLEQKSEKIIEFAAKELKKDFNKLYDEITPRIYKSVDSLHDAFEEAIYDEKALDRYGIDRKVLDVLIPLIKQRIKPPQVTITGTLKLRSYDPDGLSIIKEAAKKGLDDHTSIRYAGGGRFGITVTHSNYKEAEKVLGHSTSAIEKYLVKKGGEFVFERKVKA